MVLGLWCPLKHRRPSAGTRQTQRKIAILGGGMAGLSAAYQLTKTPELSALNHVTVYQLGWRLGGKAASGRDSQGRNLEHGLHVWFGCYENTFRLLQELYANRTPAANSRLKTWRDAVKSQEFTPIGVLREDGSWTYSPITWPSNDGTPGTGGLLPTWGEILETVLGWVAEVLSHLGQAPPAATVAVAGMPPPGVAVPQAAQALRSAQEHIREHGSRLHNQNEDQLNHLVQLIRWARDAHVNTRGLPAAPASHDQILSELLEILRAAVQGIAFDLVLPNRPFESLDDEDFRSWLIRHGADRNVVRTSSVVRIVYDTLFQYIDGDVSQPSYAAGTALGVIARLVGTYKGSMMWDLQAGIGEILIAPLYQHLLQAGVTFKFFRKVVSIEPADNAPAVQTIRIDQQAKTLDGDYKPLIDVDGLTCWPSEPLWSQLENGAEMQKDGTNFESYWCPRKPVHREVLTRGVDFDIVILAISLGAYKNLNGTDGSICAGLMARSPRLNHFVTNVGVVPTQSVQLWCDASTHEMGWTAGKAATVSGPEYLNIWGDMTQVVAFEPWSGPPPRSLHYLTGTYKTTLFKEPSTNTGVPKTAHDEVGKQTVEWLNTVSHALWPRSTAGGTFEWAVLRASAGTLGEARLKDQFWRANIDPTECCTLSSAGTTKFRLHPDQSGFDNLILAGEGTRHGFNTTAIEGAVMSGSAASRAICGEPTIIPGYDFLQRKPSDGPGP